MNKNGENTYKEIFSQPQVWGDTLQAFQSQKGMFDHIWQEKPVDLVIFTGCGSTYYLSLTAAALVQHLTGIAAQARPASELVLFPELTFPKGKRVILVTISRSGETSETILALQTFRQRVNGNVIAITCNSQSTLAKEADFAFSSDAAQENSIAQTRSFTSMTILVEALAAHLANLDTNDTLNPLPSTCQRLLDEYHAMAKTLGEADHIQRFFFLGAGYLYGIAAEAMLKMKEMSLAYSEAFHPLEFRHGPMSMVSNQSLVVGLLSKNAYAQEIAVLNQMYGLGGNILVLVEDDQPKFTKSYHVVRFKSGTPPWAQPVLYLPILQLIAYYRSLYNNQNPDQPQNLSAVVTLETLSS